jgi:inhibitor of KinA sporulation pathway (predicted exonuclease)
MSTKINQENTVTLIDGSTINVRPLKISLLRDFMKKFDDIAKVADDNSKSMTVLMECVQIAMKQYKPELSEDLKVLEDALDLPTVYAIVEAASGINLGATSLISPASN